MLPFPFYLQLGFGHISNLAGFDHIMFLVALCAVYPLSRWKDILILVTAFTIGHSVTLALAALDLLTVPSSIIKFLIPLTIFLTAISNVLMKSKPDSFDVKKRVSMKWNYLAALFFGFIHGMDFSNYFKALLGEMGSIVMPLLGFNIGIELGQLLVVAVVVTVAFVAMGVFRVKHREWNLFVSGATAGMSFLSMLDNKFW